MKTESDVVVSSTIICNLGFAFLVDTVSEQMVFYPLTMNSSEIKLK